VPPFFGPLAALADGPGVVVVGAHADMTVAMMRIAAALIDRRDISFPPRDGANWHSSTVVWR
jgi:hypothetical protein